mmetsp:Transcript_10279/g.30321  ORF Transcript_10279/g.30321 Transcript_10279/m.30321 type:complete len:95 (+) Transcript_10279:2-286(+)
MIEAQEGDLDSIRQKLGPTHPQVAEQLSSIGLYHQHMAQDLENALLCFEQALWVLCLTEEREGSYKVDIAITLTDIGNVCRCINNNERAATAYR